MPTAITVLTTLTSLYSAYGIIRNTIKVRRKYKAWRKKKK